jgi:hypothetical protein
MEVINKKYYTINYTGNIMFIDYKEGTEITVEIMKQMMQDMIELSKGKKFAVFSDLTKNISSTAEARIYGAKNEFTSYTVANAVITNSLAIKIMVNFFITFNKPEKPTRLFKDRKGAVDWLKTYLKSEGL